MGKIKVFINKVKYFRLFDYLLGRKVRKIDEQIELNIELIDFYNKKIEDAEWIIKDSTDMIKSYVVENVHLMDTKKDINKLK